MIPQEQNIFLTGMMGTGKSTVGAQLAKILNKKFVDTDAYLERVTGKTIREIFQESGEKKFRSMETEYFKYKAEESNQIFSTGGGIVLQEENRNILNKQGYTILLRVQPQSLAKRIDTSSTRPLLQQAKNVKERLAIIWKTRKPLYESSADFIVDADSLSPEDVVKVILKHLTKINENN